MAINTESFKGKKELPEVKKKPSNPNRLHMSYDEAVQDNRRMKELDARKAALDKEFEEEGAKAVKVKKTKKVQVETSEGTEEV